MRRYERPPAGVRSTPDGRARAVAELTRSGAAGCGDADLLAAAAAMPLAAAASVLDRLGGAAGIVHATHAELRGAGLGPARATTLVAARELVHRGRNRLPTAPWQVRSPADVGDRVLAGMAQLEREELRVAVLNTRNVVTRFVTVYVGNLGGSSVRVGEVFRDAVRANAASIVVVHNHPSGDPTPSADDLQITRELADAGRLLDIALLDHLVIGQDRWVSLRALGVV
jgi:DNA repair protein RadC